MQRHHHHVCLSTLLADPYSLTLDEFEGLLAMTAAAGFDGVSLWTLHQQLIKEPAAKLAERVSHHGLRVACVEAIFGWSTASNIGDAVADARVAIDLAVAVGATEIVGVMLDAEWPDRQQAVTNLAAVGAVAADAGVGIAIEFLPWTAMPNLRAAWEIAEATNQPNVGILIDSWHWLRQPGGAATALDVLGDIPGSRIRLLQPCDARSVAGPDLMTEAMTQRLLPGQGAVDHTGLLRTLSIIGADPMVAAEVFNTDLVQQDPAVFARAVRRATTETLERWDAPLT